ncbi:TIGR01777 family oxidoreductase [Winogradskyella haliclonae]|uniref:NAD-dependent epimerase n=1 Tax=Winogradskyella haliclonae TaxID=2048558 RepID=A0ABQ2C069_9FLAO|nr:TIGR01777 family oxidoreductase [Winogradskyella haliclonae]GGI58144.1 NAD-dependent epimerase [Winogradskyella haliclonae]
MRVLITGATGLVGKEIVKLCHEDGIAVNYLTTSKSKLQNQDNYKGFYWNPKAGEIDKACFNDVDTLINLVGASISKRWISSYKKEVLESRTHTARLLKKTIDDNNFSVKHVVSASAIGIYPSSLVNYFEEDFDKVSNTFLGEVVKHWETAIDAFKTSHIDVCKLRIGLVLSEKGGALPEIIRPIKFGAGAAFGTGDQWQSWIHVEDLAKLFMYAVKQGLTGVYNAVAPNPVTNAELTKTAAKVLKRPLVLPNIPKFAMKLALGEMHMLLFESQRVSSLKIEQEGFDFTFANLEPALKDLLG